MKKFSVLRSQFSGNPTARQIEMAARLRALIVTALFLLIGTAAWGQSGLQTNQQLERTSQRSSALLEPGADPHNRLWLPFLGHLARDQEQFWASPKELQNSTALKTFVPFAVFTGALIAGDSWISRQVPDTPSQTKRSKNISKYAMLSLIGGSSSAYLLGHAIGNDHLSETGLLSGEAAINSTLAAYAFKAATGRHRPYQGKGSGEFLRGGSSFPSEHAAIAWSIASVVAHEHLLHLIESIGSNEIWAEYESGAPRITDAPFDFLTLGDMQAVQTGVPGIVAATPVVKLGERIPARDGRERDVLILGVYSDYWAVRSLVPVSGRFFDRQDERDHSKACVITASMARNFYGGPEQSIGRLIRLSGLPFTVIGTFRERVDTLGQTEIAEDTIVIPYSVSRYLSNTQNVKMLYFSVAEPSIVQTATTKIRNVIVARHRPESVYTVQNLSQLAFLADRVTRTTTLVLIGIASVTLLVGGIGIMNIMLATIGSRVGEIGIRKTIGATAGDIRLQFLSEASAISLGGGLIGVLIGFGLPYSLRLFTEYRIPVSGLSVIVAIAISSLVGILFGTVPATKAARLDPIESLRHE